MDTQLDERQELIRKIELLSLEDVQKVKVFIAGVEAGRAMSVGENRWTEKQTVIKQ